MRGALSWALALAIVIGAVAAISMLALVVFSLAVAFPTVTLAVMLLAGVVTVALFLWVVVAGVRDWVSERL